MLSECEILIVWRLSVRFIEQPRLASKFNYIQFCSQHLAEAVVVLPLCNCSTSYIFSGRRWWTKLRCGTSPSLYCSTVPGPVLCSPIPCAPNWCLSMQGTRATTSPALQLTTTSWPRMPRKTNSSWKCSVSFGILQCGERINVSSNQIPNFYCDCAILLYHNINSCSWKVKTPVCDKTA